MQCGGSSNEDEKIAQRRDLLAHLRTLTPADRTRAATRIQAHLATTYPPTRHLVIAGFLPLPNEPDLTPFFLAVQDASGAIAVPRLLTLGSMEFRRLPPGSHAITPPTEDHADTNHLNTESSPTTLVDRSACALDPPQPGKLPHLRQPNPTHCPLVDPSTLTLILVPGLGFAPGGHRLGRGGGYYDRWLATLDPARRPPVIGVAFAGQVQSSLPVHPHDHPVDAIVTEEGWVPGARLPPTPATL